MNDLEKIVSTRDWRVTKIIEYFRSSDKKRTGFKLCYGKNGNYMIGKTADSYFERRFKRPPKYAVLSERKQDTEGRFYRTIEFKDTNEIYLTEIVIYTDKCPD